MSTYRTPRKDLSQTLTSSTFPELVVPVDPRLLRLRARSRFAKETAGSVDAAGIRRTPVEDSAEVVRAEDASLASERSLERRLIDISRPARPLLCSSYSWNPYRFDFLRSSLLSLSSAVCVSTFAALSLATALIVVPAAGTASPGLGSVFS